MRVSFPNESPEYRRARDQLLADEVALRRHMEAVAVARRALPPGGAVREDYVFETIGADGEAASIKLSELFGDHDAILMDQMMFPRWSTDDRAPAAHGETAKLTLKGQPCPSCVALVDQLNAAAPHFEAAGGRFYVVAKTRIENLAALARDRGWTNLRLLSAAGSSFKRDYGSENENDEQLPVTTVFKRDADGTIRHFWTAEMIFDDGDPGQDPRAQGTIEPFWNMLDLMPGGRGSFEEQLQYPCCERHQPKGKANV
jgi:predicted dithiol-disulfide oxidoreductase (DUF899 family)